VASRAALAQIDAGVPLANLKTIEAHLAAGDRQDERLSEQASVRTGP
jgi:hypothetical protein